MKMAVELWLGPSGSEVLLPPVNWIGEPGEYPESWKRNYESATMLGGKIRYVFKANSQRSWTVEWAMLTKAQSDAIQALADLRQHLRFKHGMMINPAWITVAVMDYTALPILSTFRTGSIAKYHATLTLEEAS